jgi:transcriptional regulator with XRE-family HTH domain
MSQERLAELVSQTYLITSATVSRLETGKTPWSQAALEAIATVLQCEVVDLLAKNLTKEDMELRDALRGRSDESKRQILRVIAAMTSSEVA